ncbi:MAG: pilus assembly protein PilM, partial [Acidobacteria bacterium]|nr:pilus assembly protein PilM [Acidobacteriota bacterium]
MSHLWRMSGWFGRRSAALVGLDVGSSAVKAVELETTRAGRRVVAAAAAPLPRQASRDGAHQDGDAVAGAS